MHSPFYLLVYFCSLPAPQQHGVQSVLTGPGFALPLPPAAGCIPRAYSREMDHSGRRERAAFAGVAAAREKLCSWG